MSLKNSSNFLRFFSIAEMNGSGKPSYRFKSFLLNAEERQLSRDGEPVGLTPKVFDTLVHLVENAGHLVEKRELMESVWRDSFVEDGNLARSIHTLRRALGQDGNGNKFIETVPTKGYRFVAEVQVLDRGFIENESKNDNDRSSEIGRQPAGDPVTGIEGETAREDRNSRKYPWKALAFSLCVVLAVCLGGWLLYEFTFAERVNSPIGEITLSRLSNTTGVKRLSVSPDGNLIAYVSNGKDGEGLFVRQTQRSNTLNLVSPQKGHFSFVRFSPDGKDIFYGLFSGDKKDTEVFSVPALGGVSRRIPNLVAYSMSFAPDKKSFAHVISNMEDGEKTLMISSIAGEVDIPLKTRKLPRSFNVVEKPCSWSPDGKIIAVISNDVGAEGRFSTLVGVSPEDGSETLLTEKRWTFLESVTWLKDQSGLLAVGSERPEMASQVWFVSAADGSVRRLTNDLNDYSQIDVTDDGTQIVAMQESRTSSVWLGSIDQTSNRFKEIVSETGQYDSIAMTPKRTLIFRSNADGEPDLWSLEPDQEKKQITSGARVVGLGLCVTADGNRVIFPSRKAGKTNLWIAELAGGEPRQLTFGDGEFFPLCSNDGSVIYQTGFGYGVKSKLWKIPVEGGEAAQLTDYFAMRPAISPDGSSIAFFYMTNDKWRIGIIPSNGGPIQRSVDVPEGVIDRVVRWSHDGDSLLYAANTGEVGNVWLLPLSGEQPKRLTNFDSHVVNDFFLTNDGKELVVARTATTEDVVALTLKP